MIPQNCGHIHRQTDTRILVMGLCRGAYVLLIYVPVYHPILLLLYSPFLIRSCTTLILLISWNVATTQNVLKLIVKTWQFLAPKDLTSPVLAFIPKELSLRKHSVFKTIRQDSIERNSIFFRLWLWGSHFEEQSFSFCFISYSAPSHKFPPPLAWLPLCCRPALSLLALIPLQNWVSSLLTSPLWRQFPTTCQSTSLSLGPPSCCPLGGLLTPASWFVPESLGVVHALIWESWQKFVFFISKWKGDLLWGLFQFWQHSTVK